MSKTFRPWDVDQARLQQRRLEKLREVKAAIEAEAKAEAEARAADKAAAEKATAEGSQVPTPTVKHPKHHIDGTP